MSRFHRGTAAHLLRRLWPRSQDAPGPGPFLTCRYLAESCEAGLKQLIRQKPRRPSAEWSALVSAEVSLPSVLYPRRDALPLARCSFFTLDAMVDRNFAIAPLPCFFSAFSLIRASLRARARNSASQP